MIRKPRRIACLLLIMLLPAILAGCWDKRELEEQAFVMSMGVDLGTKEGTYIWTFRIASPRPLAGGQASGGGDQPASSLISIESPSVFGALNLLNAFVDRKANLMHTKVILVGEELAKKDPMPLRTLSRYREIRNNIFVLIAEGKAKDVLKKNKPVLEKNPSKFAETLILNSSFTGFTPQTKLLNFLTALQSDSTYPTAILVGINAGLNSTKVNRKSTSPYLPGEIPREGDTPMEIIGAAVFKENHMVAKLDGTENRIMSHLNGKFHRSYFVMKDPLSPKHSLALDVRAGSLPITKVSLKDGRPFISVELSFEADILEIQSTIDYTSQKNMKKLEEIIEKYMQQSTLTLIKKTQRLGTDIFGFGNKARHLVSTWSEWEDLNWQKLYPKADVDVKIHFSIRRIGLQYEPIRHTN